MADTENNKIWIHLLMEKDLAESLDQMVTDDDSDRSKFIRKLVREEVSRRQIQNLPNSKYLKRRKNDRRAAQAVAA